ncbi:MAG: sulfopyruvate decarboxylase subunit alpha [Candidatus Bathyarchaeota archaeon]
MPCSILNEVIFCLSTDPDVQYIPATREDEATGIAAGAYLGGKRPVILMQNSGLGYSLGAFTSLAILYRLPILLLITWRGYKGKDAPQHRIMGSATLNLLKEIGIPYRILSKHGVNKVIDWASQTLEKKQTPTALVIKRDVIK